jgi:predicted  nucleic acid-binding Zn-ribbon protein
MNEALNALYELQRVDSALAVANRKYQALDPGRAEQSAAESARAVHERMVREHHETARDLQDAELELKSIESKKIDYEYKLKSGKGSWKELEQYQAEVDALGRHRAMLDERILTLMDQLEERRRAEQESKQALDAAEAALAAKASAFKTDSRTLSSQIKTLTAAREERVKPIAAPLLKRYEAIRVSKQGVGIAKLDGDDCGACHTNLPSEVVENVVKSECLETCPNCGRLLCMVS